MLGQNHNWKNIINLTIKANVKCWKKTFDILWLGQDLCHSHSHSLNYQWSLIMKSTVISLLITGLLLGVRRPREIQLLTKYCRLLSSTTVERCRWLRGMVWMVVSGTERTVRHILAHSDRHWDHIRSFSLRPEVIVFLQRRCDWKLHKKISIEKNDWKWHIISQRLTNDLSVYAYSPEEIGLSLIVFTIEAKSSIIVSSDGPALGSVSSSRGIGSSESICWTSPMLLSLSKSTIDWPTLRSQ